MQDNIDVIKFLLKNGADKEIQSIKGKKAIDLCDKHPAKNTILKLLNSTNYIEEKEQQKKTLQYKPQPINLKQVKCDS